MTRDYKPDPASTPTGIIFGSVKTPPIKDIEPEMVRLQKALLQSATSRPPSMMQRITYYIRRLLLI